MKLTGKIIGGTLGSLFGGPAGTVIGAGVGHFFDFDLDRPNRMAAKGFVECELCRKWYDPRHLPDHHACPNCGIQNVRAMCRNCEKPFYFRDFTRDFWCDCRQDCSNRYISREDAHLCSIALTMEEYKHDGNLMVQVRTLWAMVGSAKGEILQVQENLLRTLLRNHYQIPEYLFEDVLADTSMRGQLKLPMFTFAENLTMAIDTAARKLYNLTINDFNTRFTILDGCYQMALAEGYITQQSNMILDIIVSVLNLPNDTYEYIKNHYRKKTEPPKQPEPPIAYTILGCNPSDSMETIRAKYKELVKQFHPDKYASQNLPPMLKEKAVAWFREIQEAYEEVEKLRL